MNEGKRLVIGNGPGDKLELALGRNDGSLEDIEWLSSGENSKQITLLRIGRAELVLKTEPVVSYCQSISDGQMIVVGQTNGKATLAQAKDVFPGYIDPEFVAYGTDVSGQPTKKQKVRVLEIVRDGNFQQIFGGFSLELERLCLEQSQIRRFCLDHANWLRVDGYGTFFLFKVKKDFFVASVRWYDRRQKVYAYCLSREYVWRAEHRQRIVVPQL